MTPVITAFSDAPDEGQGLARDMGVRWALEEVGQDYDVRLLSFHDLKEPAHRQIQPFGQIPTWQDDTSTLFESGAIVLHIAERYRGLLSPLPALRARSIAWMFAALNTVEPPIVELDQATMLEADKGWYDERQAMLEQRILSRLHELAAWLGDRDWLETEFSAGDLMMVTVLRRLHGSGLLEVIPSLVAYVARGEARPAFRRAFAAQLDVFRDFQSRN